MTQATQQQHGPIDHVKQFYERVKSMRNAQKMYFKHRDMVWLQESKRLEAEVDYLLTKQEGTAR